MQQREARVETLERGMRGGVVVLLLSWWLHLVRRLELNYLGAEARLDMEDPASYMTTLHLTDTLSIHRLWRILLLS
jgi:hypothetical protein